MTGLVRVRFAGEPDPERRSAAGPQADYRSALAMAATLGWPETFAASWAAYCAGLAPATETRWLRWTWREVRSLIFLRWAVEHGRVQR